MWQPLKEIDFSNPAIGRWRIDTRDFYFATGKEKELELDKILKYKEQFFFTPEEVHTIINRLYTESGGEGGWRMICLAGVLGERYTSNWQIKYISIVKTEHGLVICNKDYEAIRREIWELPVDMRYLNHH